MASLSKAKPRCVLDALQLAGIAGGLLRLGYFLAGELQGIFTCDALAPKHNTIRLLFSPGIG